MPSGKTGQDTFFFVCDQTCYRSCASIWILNGFSSFQNYVVHFSKQIHKRGWFLFLTPHCIFPDRCLRTVCDSWTLFVEFPFEENINDSSSKRRRLLLETPEVEHNRKLHPQAFENAKDCLLSLQNSVLRLHQKKLFPYNPEALLRRLVYHGYNKLIILCSCFNFFTKYFEAVCQGLKSSVYSTNNTIWTKGKLVANLKHCYM